jgi:hypothetical protein
LTHTDLKNFQELIAKKPKTKSSLVRTLWPEIRQALAAGHSMKEICLALNKDGAEISYQNLRYCVGCLRRKKVAEMEQPRSNSFNAPMNPGPLNSNDPGAALKAQRAKKIKFDHDPFSTRIEDLV